MIFHSNIYFCLNSSFISPFLQVYRKGLSGVSKRYMPVSNWYVGVSKRPVSKRLSIELTGYQEECPKVGYGVLRRWSVSYTIRKALQMTRMLLTPEYCI